MIRNKSLGKRLLAAGIMLIFSMSGCGTDNEIELTGNGIGSDGIEAAADGYFTSFITSDIAPVVFMMIFL